MTSLEFDEFDDELRNMQEMMDKAEISFDDESLAVPLKKLPLKSAIVVEVGASIGKCIELMLSHEIGCLLVIKNKKLVGIFTERDVLLKIAGEGYTLSKIKIDDFMTPDPEFLSIDDSIVAALKLMHNGGYRHIVIVDEKNEPVAVVSIKDIVSYIVEYFPQEILNLPPHPIRIGTKNREGG